VEAKIKQLPSASGKFSDISSYWAKDSINSCASAGILGGYADNAFRPDRYSTRAEAAKMISALLQ
jgi:hypothetical protein